ncbi:hypothetical protein V8F06_003598 [Rhypophila decipiens]
MELTDTHILTILAFGPRVCKKLLSFTFAHEDFSYNANNDALEVHGSSLVALARACPSLREFTIQGVSLLDDECLLALYRHCPRLEFIEIRSYDGGDRQACAFTETAFTALRDNPDWMPKLKNLRLSFGSFGLDEKADKGPQMKAMREVTRLRETLVVTRVRAKEHRRRNELDNEAKEEHWTKSRKRERWWGLGRRWLPPRAPFYNIWRGFD